MVYYADGNTNAAHRSFTKSGVQAPVMKNIEDAGPGRVLV